MSTLAIANRILLLTYMDDLHKERNEKYVPEAVKEMPDIRTISVEAFIGTFSWCVPKWKKRYLLEPYIIPVSGGIATPSEVARDYLKTKYPKKRRIRKATLDAVKIHRSPPLYAHPCKLDDAIYIDLKAAYWNILLAVGWDVEYQPGDFIGVQSSNADFPYPENKLARNCLVSAGLPGNSTVWTGTKLEIKGRFNPQLNHSIWAVCQDVLNGIALEMKAAGAVYINTDGYIFPSGLAHRAFEILGGWGLPYGVKAEGAGWVAGVGVYRVGKTVSKRKMYAAQGYYEPFYAPHSEWLKPRIRKLYEKRVYISGLL